MEVDVMGKLLFLLDPGTLGLVGMALCAVIFGSYQSRAIFFHPTESTNDQGSSSTPRGLPLLATNSSVIKKRTAILLPIIGSLTLVVLFYFLDEIFYLLLIVLISCSFFSLLFIQMPFASYFIRSIRMKYPIFPRYIIKMPKLGRIPVEVLFVVPLPLLLTLLYFIYDHWIIINIFALSIAAFSLAILRVTNLKVAIIMLTFFFLYDMFWVFFSSLLFDQNVMVVVATNLSNSYNYRLPMAIQIPTVFRSGINILGLGDIILPGFLLSFLYRFDMSIEGHAWHGYFLNGCIGYTVGLLLALVMIVSMNGIAQPALTYLIPCTLFPTLVMGYWRKELKNLWLGSSGRLHVLQSTDIRVDDIVEPDGLSIQLQPLSGEEQEALDSLFDDEEDGDGIEMEFVSLTSSISDTELSQVKDPSEDLEV